MFFETAVGTALTFIFLFTYVGIRKVAGFAWLVDIGIFALMLWLFKGTFSGVMTGMLAGLLITLFLKMVRRFLGYEVPTMKRRRDQLVPHIIWEERKL